MVAELFLQEARPVAVTIATIVNWLANFVVELAFPYILVSLYNITHTYIVHSHTMIHTCNDTNIKRAHSQAFSPNPGLKTAQDSLMG